MNTCTRFVVGAVLFFLLSSTSRATTCAEYVFAWPADSLPLNGRIVLQGSSWGAEIVKDMIVLNPRLEAVDHTISLLVGEQYEGAGDTKQVVLIPNQPLSSNTTYRFKIDSMRLFYFVETIGIGTSTRKRFASFTDTNAFEWTTTYQWDYEPPVWRNSMSVQVRYNESLAAPTYVEPDYNIALYPDIADADPIILAEFTPKDNSGSTQKCFLFPRNPWSRDTTRIWISVRRPGTGVQCPTSIILREDTEYRVTYTAIDVAGNRSQGPSDCTISFVNDGKFVRGFSTGCSGAPTPPVKPAPSEIRVE